MTNTEHMQPNALMPEHQSTFFNLHTVPHFFMEVIACPNLVSTRSFNPSCILVCALLDIVRCQLDFTTHIETASAKG